MITLSLAEIRANDSSPMIAGTLTKYLCPLCGNGKPKDNAHRTFWVGPNGGLGCFRCGFHGKALGTQEINQAQIAHNNQMRRADEAKKKRMNSQVKIYGLNTDTGIVGLDYLESRGITLSIALRAKVSFCPAFLSKRPAVVFLTCDEAGKVIGKQGRYLDTEEPKTRTAGPGGVFATADAWQGAVTICEAPLDALSLACLGTPAISVQGTNLPLWLPRHLKDRPVQLASDSDAPGDAAAEKWRQQLQGFASRLIRLRPPLHDWNDVLMKGMKL